MVEGGWGGPRRQPVNLEPPVVFARPECFYQNKYCTNRKVSPPRPRARPFWFRSFLSRPNRPQTQRLAAAAGACGATTGATGRRAIRRRRPATAPACGRARTAIVGVATGGRHLTAVSNGDRLLRLVFGVDLAVLNHGDDIHARDHLQDQAGKNSASNGVRERRCQQQPRRSTAATRIQRSPARTRRACRPNAGCRGTATRELRRQTIG